MAIPSIFAMTGYEIDHCPVLPDKIAWMSFHFSQSNSGLSDLPPYLPAASMIVVDDQLPFHSHDPEKILRQLSGCVRNTQAGGVVLDFQRPITSHTRELAQKLVQALPCPVAVPPGYAKEIDCPIFLPPIPPDIPWEAYLKPWAEREIWLEVALDAAQITVTREGSTVRYHAFAHPASDCHRDEQLHCHYRIAAQEDLRFYLFRTREDVKTLLAAIDSPNIKYAIALFQEFRKYDK